MVRYYGKCSNCVRVGRRKAGQVEAIPTVLEPEISLGSGKEELVAFDPEGPC